MPPAHGILNAQGRLPLTVFEGLRSGARPADHRSSWVSKELGCQ
jgi:hypothetical protein